MFTFERLFDTAVTIEKRERAKKQDLQTGRKRRRGGRPRAYRCHVCAFESEDPSFCPTCLADTMRPR